MVTLEFDHSSADAAVQGEAAPIAPAELERLSGEYARTRDPRLRETLILHHQRLVKVIASRFMSNVETLDDLVQVGTIGLINALDRYIPENGTRFSTYAAPTIRGEIRRHFRDKTCGIKVPRPLQELHTVTIRITRQLTQELGRTPTVAELAVRLGTDEEEVMEVLGSGRAMNLLSLDECLDTPTSPGTMALIDVIGQADKAVCEFEMYADLRKALETLDTRERQIISLRFFGEVSQVKIAEKLSMSQMHVSRLQRRALKRLREMLSDDAGHRDYCTSL